MNDLPAPDTVVFADEPFSDAVFDRLLVDLGDAEKALAVFQVAFTRWCEIRAAQGDAIPEAYFTHALIDAKWGNADKATITRWIDLAVDAASP